MTPEILVGIGTIVISVLTVVAIIVAPIVALNVQRKADEAREWKNRKLWIFKTLMSKRSTRLNPAFVQALNMIDIEFTAAPEKGIQDAWKNCSTTTTTGAGRRQSRERLMTTGTWNQCPTCSPNSGEDGQATRLRLRQGICQESLTFRKGYATLSKNSTHYEKGF